MTVKPTTENPAHKEGRLMFKGVVVFIIILVVLSFF